MVNVAIVGGEKSGRTALASKLGKKGTESDIVLYNFDRGESAYIFADAKDYPRSLKSLITALGISDIAILCIPPGGVTAQTGEGIIALDLLGIKRGLIVITMSDLSNPFAIEEMGKQLRILVRGTALESWDICAVSTVSFEGMEKLKEKLFTIGAEIAKEKESKCDAPTRVMVDHSFNVTGIGCVILGVELQGTLSLHDQLMVFPIQRNIEIRSIQVQDIDVESARSGDRIGAALKGVQSKELGRGAIISRGEQVSSKLTLQCIISRFTPGVKVEEVVHLFAGLQSTPARITAIAQNGNECASAKGGTSCTITVETQSAIAYSAGDKMLLAQLNAPKQRFVARCTV